MKNILALVVTLLITTLNFAQQGINYKALIKDDLGNVVANQEVTLRFSILDALSGGTILSQNLYNDVMTDANGIVIVNIGSGGLQSLSYGLFNEIDWGSHAHFLRVEIDINGGANFTDIGTTEFMAVPYAKHASVADNISFKTINNVTSNSAGDTAIDNFVFGSTQLNNDFSTDYGARMFFDRIRGAFRAGSTPLDTADPNNGVGTEWDSDNLGSSSFASGSNTKAAGYISTAMGSRTVASGNYSFATGNSAIASGNNSTAMGSYTEASGESSTTMGSGGEASAYFSTAMGVDNYARSYGETAIGHFSKDYTPIGTDYIVGTDRLFVIGNGTSVSTTGRSNALTVLQNGYISIGGYEPSSLLEIAHKNGSPLSESLSILNTDTNNAWQFHTTNYLNLYQNGLFKGSWNATSGAYVQASDRRVKKDITPLENNTLHKVMQLNPVSYLMKEQTDTKRNLGLISQEVQEIFPSITHYVEESDLLALSYTELIPILIKALQEQQIIIETQNSENTQQNQAIKSLLRRMNALEVANN
jgi:hypothetical protein